MKPEIRAAVREIRSDRERGARQLALATLEALRSVAPECDGEEFRECARELALARPMMATIQNAVAWAWSRYLDTGNAAESVDDIIEAIQTATDGMAAAGRRVVPTDTLLTYSYSSSVIDLLGRLKPRHVIVSETRPSHEGVRMARELAAQGISMTLITEAQMALFVQEADAVIVGADTILPEGDLINRIGTRLLALAARDAEVPLYAISETLKVAAPSSPMPFAPEEGQPKEVCGEKWLEVRNVYYELTPARLVSAYVTETGIVDPAAVGRYAEDAEKRWRALMDSLEA
ncbi:MAG TPA: translation initiation factor eIF-2B [Dehalococcoidia bacterium]|nr:translation initiation factor eIF-2B [Dehalococcoidia bacterium]